MKEAMKTKHLTKLTLCLLTILFMMIGLCYTVHYVHAQGNGSIIINPPAIPTGVQDQHPENHPTYTIYRAFNGNGNGTNIRYSLLPGKTTHDTAWSESQMSAYFDVDSGGNVKIKAGASHTIDGKTYLTAHATEAVKSYVEKLHLTGSTATYDSTNNNYEFSNLDDGYYYITTTTGTVVLINSINHENAITINDKNSIPSVDKKQTTEVNSNTPINYTDNDVNVATGDTIYYETTVNVPAGITEDIILNDHLSVSFIPNFAPTATGTNANDLTPIQNGDITVQYQNGNSWENLNKGTDTDLNYTITANWTANDKAKIDGFTVHLKPTAAVKGKTIRFLYSAIVGGGFMNDDSQDQDTSEKLIDQKRNKIEMTYKNYHQEDKVYFHTDCAGAIKYDTSTANVNPSNQLAAKEGKEIKYLPEAKFKLQERINNSEWTDTPVVCNGSREFYRPAVLDQERTESQHKFVGKDGDNVLDYQSENNGFIQANEGEMSDHYNRGWIVFRGLDPDKQYRLVECQAPDGYNKLTQPIELTKQPDTKFKVSLTGSAPANDGADGTGKHEEFYWKDRTEFLSDDYIIKIGNTPGTPLPVTGSVGTMMFDLAGGILVIGATLLLIKRRKA